MRFNGSMLVRRNPSHALLDSIFGGLLIVMGQRARSEALFYCFRLEDQIPEDHLLRLINKHISFEFLRGQPKGSYNETGRPSIDFVMVN